MPLAEVFRVAFRVVQYVCTGALCNDALDNFELLQSLFLSLALNLVAFLLFGITHVHLTEDELLIFDIIVHAFNALVLLQECIEFIGIVKMRICFPLDMEALEQR